MLLTRSHMCVDILGRSSRILLQWKIALLRRRQEKLEHEVRSRFTSKNASVPGLDM